MTVVATLSIDIHISVPKGIDPLLAEADAVVAGRPGTIRLTTRGLYLTVDNGPSWGIDLNALARAMADAVAPPMKSEGGPRG